MEKISIVLVEDDPALLEMYKLKFTESGFDFKVATDGEAGLALIREAKPKMVLLDVMLPKMDGFAVLAEIKKDPALQATPVLLLTNLGQKTDMEKGQQLGATDYIVKSSLTPAQVVEKVNEHIAK